MTDTEGHMELVLDKLVSEHEGDDPWYNSVCFVVDVLNV